MVIVIAILTVIVIAIVIITIRITVMMQKNIYTRKTRHTSKSRDYYYVILANKIKNWHPTSGQIGFIEIYQKSEFNSKYIT